MHNPNNLPAISLANNKVSSKEVAPYTTASYIVANGEEGVTIAQIPEEREKILHKRRAALTRKDGIIAGAGLLIEHSGYLLPWGSLEQLGVVLTGGLITLDRTLRKSGFVAWHISRQKKAAAAALSSPNALHFPEKRLGVCINKDAIADEQVAIAAEDGRMQQSAVLLLDSIGLYAPGIKIQPSPKNDTLHCTVSPGKLVRQALALVAGSDKDIFLQQVEPSLQQIHEASHLLLPVGLTNDTPDSMRERLHAPATRLLLGSLAVYGTLRAYYAPTLGTQLKEMYATDQEEYAQILNDAVRLNTPTAHNLSWAEIEQFRIQLGV